MALFGSARDVSMFRGISRELMWDVIVQECALYKFRLEETNVNIYGEAAEEKYYEAPMLLNTLIDRQDQNFPDSDLGIDFTGGRTFKFLRDDLLGIESNGSGKIGQIVPEVGDIIWYEKGYYEIYKLINNQLFVGKDPDYPWKDDDGYNAMGNYDLENFGYDVSIIAEAHYVPADRVGISEERLISNIKHVK
tara:strand:- start:2797 stop:3372 length:576 start_codon:yes stop_codon:yes gene_type:complete